MKKHPLIWFYILAFAIAWLGWAPIALSSRGTALIGFPFLLILPAVAPALAAIIVAQVRGGWTGVQDLLRPLIQWHVGWVWYLVAVLGPLLLLLAGLGITKLLGLSGAKSQMSLLALIISAFIIALLSNTCEEIGWRGFELPRLQKGYLALPASL